MGMGFLPGRKVRILQISDGMFVTKVAEDTPITIDETAAAAVMVRPLQDDVFSAKTGKTKEGLVFKIIKLLKLFGMSFS